MKTARPPATAASQTGSLKHTIDRLRETIERTAPRPSMRPAPANDTRTGELVFTWEDDRGEVVTVRKSLTVTE
jgi:hypothetical protein